MKRRTKRLYADNFVSSDKVWCMDRMLVWMCIEDPSVNTEKLHRSAWVSKVWRPMHGGPVTPFIDVFVGRYELELQ